MQHSIHPKKRKDEAGGHREGWEERPSVSFGAGGVRLSEGGCGCILADCMLTDDTVLVSLSMTCIFE